MPELIAVPPQVLSRMARRCPVAVPGSAAPPCLEPAAGPVPAATGLEWWLLVWMLPFLAVGLAVLVAVFVPAVVVGLVLFLPALAPLLLVGAGIFLTGDLAARKEESSGQFEGPSCV
jgi:hypothetical protein